MGVNLSSLRGHFYLKLHGGWKDKDSLLVSIACNFNFYASGFNQDGYDRDGYGHDGFNCYGFNREGYNKWGYNREGVDIEGNRDTDQRWDCLNEKGKLHYFPQNNSAKIVCVCMCEHAYVGVHVCMMHSKHHQC